MPFIEDIFIMDEIFSMERKIEQQYGIPILNVSHWNSSKNFQKQMAKALVLPKQSLPWDYYYTYSISPEDRKQVLAKLGVSSQQQPYTMGLLLQSSTIAIVNVINLLIHFGKKKLCILQPAYFSVELCCSRLSLEYETEQISFKNACPQIPIEKIISKNYDCIWITSPIFCTGYYPDEKLLQDIACLKSMGMTIILDESLSLPEKELIRFFQIDKNLIAIYSPHKAISINGLKFAVVVCDKFYEDFLEQWVDVFAGALSSSNRDAIFHYISPNFSNNCYQAYKSYIEQTKNIVSNIVEQYHFAWMLPNTNGHYINIFTNLKVQGTNEMLNLLNDMIQTSLASIIPSTLNGFDSNNGFSFRVNLTNDIIELDNAINRIMKFLNTSCH